MLHRPDSPTYAKDPAIPPEKGEDSLGAVGSCDGYRAPSSIPRSAPDQAISLLLLAPNQNRK